MIEKFTLPTFAVLELPSPFADQILSLRTHSYRTWGHHPVEITVAGSSGIGTFSDQQSPGLCKGKNANMGTAHIQLTDGAHVARRMFLSRISFSS